MKYITITAMLLWALSISAQHFSTNTSMLLSSEHSFKSTHGNQYIKLIGIQGEVTEDQVNYTIEFKDEKHAAMKPTDIYTNQGEESFNKYINNLFEGWTINSINVVSMSLIDGSKYIVSMSQPIDTSKPVYLQPFLTATLDEDIFDCEAPLGNVTQTMVAQFNIPASFAIELPKDETIAAPNGLGALKYSVQRKGNRVVIVSNYQMADLHHTRFDKAALNEFVNKSLNKMQEEIILRK